LRAALVRGAPADILRYTDPRTGGLREAWVDAAGALERVLFLTRTGGLPPREWLAELFAKSELTAEDRAFLLVGRMPGQPLDASPVVCACRGVRQGRIEAAIAGGCASVDAVGETTGAGSACGSCRPEIARLLTQSPKPEVRHAA
jgi:assimilatory nitrate reductase catalytic subunit